MVTRGAVGCWDNSTQGLDASTALEYCRSLRLLTDIAKVATIVSLYQASENLYEVPSVNTFLIQLFDKVLVIQEGRCIYFGPRQHAKQYFEELGFYCTPGQMTADFLTAVTDPHARMLAGGSEDKTPQNSKDLETCFQNSADGASNLSQIVTFEEEIKNRQESPYLVYRRGVYAIPFYKQVSICTAHQFQVLWGDKLTIFAKFGLAILLSLIFESLFYNQPTTSLRIFTRGSAPLYFTFPHYWS